MTAVQIAPPTLRGAPRDDAPAAAIVDWAVETFGPRLCLTTSFADTVLVHLATQVAPDIEVVFLDTGFHFPETLATMKEALARYRLNITVARPPAGSADVWAAGTDACCGARKVNVLASVMAGGFDAWLSGLRRADAPSRSSARAVETDRHGRVKVNPLVAWSDEQVQAYIAEHELIVNPLLEQGYPSIGCWPCTTPVLGGESGRDGRWSGSTKTECGLHL